MKIGKQTLVALLLLGAGFARANNLQIDNVVLSAAGSGKALVSFDIAWDNSWRDAENFDAAWVFVKYTDDNGASWRHATLAASGVNPDGFSPGNGGLFELVVPDDKKGVFVQRQASGSGSVSDTGVELLWDFAQDGVSPHVMARVRVMGIEMVYIPEGAFYVGDTPGDFINNYQSCLLCTYIDSPDMSLTATTGSGTVEDPYTSPEGCGRPGAITGTFDPGYPNGYNAFYIMKYEMTQGMYADMLNCLTYEQALNRYPDMAPTSRNTITGSIFSTGGVFAAAAPHRAAGFFYYHDCWLDAASYVDWAALRPATEMEFEKAGRGPEVPVNKVYPWGATNFPTAFSGLTDDGADTERPANGDANANFTSASPDGPIRVGAFATNNADRVKAGAGYYGVMELGGNVIDRVVSSGGTGLGTTPQFPSYNGAHGDGELNAGGYADTPGWPGSGDHYTGRGGGWGGSTIDLQMRTRRTQTYMYQRGYGGVRAARSAPVFPEEE